MINEEENYSKIMRTVNDRLLNNKNKNNIKENKKIFMKIFMESNIFTIIIDDNDTSKN